MKVQVNKGSGQVTICIPRYLARALGYDQSTEVDPQINARGNLELVKLGKKPEASD